MTIAQAIARVDELKPNTATHTDKVRWLAQLDSMIASEVIGIHELNKGETAPGNVGYNDETPGSKELIVQMPYDDIYVRWLEAQIDYYNGETNRYNNSITMFNEMYREYNNAYNRTHKTKGPGSFIYF